jgi:hypothetical protein
MTSHIPRWTWALPEMSITQARKEASSERAGRILIFIADIHYHEFCSYTKFPWLLKADVTKTFEKGRVYLSI